MNKEKSFIGLLAELHKLKINVAVALTNLAGFTLASGAINNSIKIPLIGIFILACGSAAINQFQERKLDVLMNRTANRPIPSGRIKPQMAIILASLEIIAGTALIYIGAGFTAALLGFTAFIWYNAIYTPLKKVTPFAVIPGSVIGAIPPVVGWVVGGGSLVDPKLLVMAFFFFISQVPHFWLLLLRFGKEYHAAGFPVLTDIFNSVQIKRGTFIWIGATALNVLLLVLIGIFQTVFFKIAVLLAALWLVVVFSKLLKNNEEDFNPFSYFMKLNYFVLVIILSMIIDPLV